jgi:hypothetical protein
MLRARHTIHNQSFFIQLCGFRTSQLKESVFQKAPLFLFVFASETHQPRRFMSCRGLRPRRDEVLLEFPAPLNKPFLQINGGTLAEVLEVILKPGRATDLALPAQ